MKLNDYGLLARVIHPKGNDKYYEEDDDSLYTDGIYAIDIYLHGNIVASFVKNKDDLMIFREDGSSAPKMLSAGVPTSENLWRLIKGAIGIKQP